MDLNRQRRYKDAEAQDRPGNDQARPACLKWSVSEGQRSTAMLRNDRIIINKSNVERLRSILGSRSGLARDREHLLGLRERLKRARQPERRRFRRISSHRDRKFGYATGDTNLS
jgi:hypothetical protein